MADPAATGPAKWLWIIVILLLLVVLGVWLMKPSGDGDNVVVATQPAAQSTEWAEGPAAPKVPVELPTSQ
jgi:hypothetical protein